MKSLEKAVDISLEKTFQDFRAKPTGGHFSRKTFRTVKPDSREILSLLYQGAKEIAQKFSPKRKSHGAESRGELWEILKKTYAHVRNPVIYRVSRRAQNTVFISDHDFYLYFVKNAQNVWERIFIFFAFCEECPKRLGTDFYFFFDGHDFLAF